MNKNNSLKCICGMLFVALINISSVSADTEYKVRSTDNLNRIVNRFYQGSNLTRSQILIGILAENPDAFKGGNINFLIRGKRLMLPDENDIPDISTEDANEILTEHSRYFRKGVTGNLEPPSVVTSPNSVKNNNTIESKQLEQSKKINDLEKEREELRAQLDKLIAEKKERDLKLQDIEKELQNSLKQTKPGNSTTEEN